MKLVFSIRRISLAVSAPYLPGENAGGDCDPAAITLYNTTPSEIDSFSAPSGEGTNRTVADSHHTVKDQFGNVLADVDIPATEDKETTITIEQTCSKLIDGVVTEGAGTPEANGTWVWNEGTGQYENEDGHILNLGISGWIIVVNGVTLYRTTAPTSDNPWQEEEWVVDGGQAPAPTFAQATEPCTVTFKVGDEINGYATWEDVPADTILTIPAVDQDGNAVVVSKNVDGELVVPDLPCAPSGLTVTLEVDDDTPTVGAKITIKATATGADSFCIQFGNDDSNSGANTAANEREADYTYYFPRVYAVSALAGIKATGAGGVSAAAQDIDITVAGLLDSYAPNAFIGIAPFLLQRLYAGNGVEIRREVGSPLTSNFGYTDSVLDDFTLYVGANDGFVRMLYNEVGNNFKQDSNALQPKVVDSGTLLTNPFGGWWMRFNASEYMTAIREDFWPTGDRTKMFFAFAFSCDGNAALVTNHILSQWESIGNQRSWRAGYIHDRQKLFVGYTPDGMGGSQQIIEFSGIALNEFAICLVKIDTTARVNDRIKAWKADASGITALTRTGTTGNASGNIHNSTGNVLVGALAPSSPSSFLSGYLSPHIIISPDNVAEVDIAKIGAVMYQRISSGN